MLHAFVSREFFINQVYLLNRLYHAGLPQLRTLVMLKEVYNVNIHTYNIALQNPAFSLIDKRFAKPVS